jgi:NTE family protein
MRALVLSTGGCKGAFQVGVLKRWMGEQGIDYDIVCGVSVGALNAAALAMTEIGKPREAISRLENLWLRVETKLIYKRWFPFGRLHALWNKSVYDSSPLAEFVRQELSLSEIQASGKKLAVGAVSLDTGDYDFGREYDSNLIDWVLASSSFPVFLSPILMKGQLWSDGGIKSITPLGAAIKLGADQIDVIMCNNIDIKRTWESKTKRALPDQAVRTLDLMLEQMVLNDLKVTSLKNQLSLIDPKYRQVNVRVVMPSCHLVDNSLDFDPTIIRNMIQQGYIDADTSFELSPNI